MSDKPKINLPMSIFFTLLSAVLISLSFPNFINYEGFGILAWFCLVPLFFALERKNKKQSFFIGYLFGLVFLFSSIYWLSCVTILGFVVLVCVLSIFFAFFGFLYSKLLEKENAFSFLNIVFIPSLWVILEFIRNYFLTGFPWNILSYTQYKFIYVIQMADTIGCFGISFLIVMVNYAFFSLLKNNPHKKQYLALAVWFFAIACVYGYLKLDRSSLFVKDTEINIAVIQGNVKQDVKWDPHYSEEIFEKYKKLSVASINENPDLIIWPETAIPYLLNEQIVTDEITNIVGESKKYLLAGVVREDNNKYYNSAVLFSDKAEITGIYDKVHLVPFGEYIPFESTIQWFRNKIDKPIGDFSFGKKPILLTLPISKNLEIGEPSYVKRQTRFYKFGVLICYEDIFPQISRKLKQNGADFLVNITNDAWFGKTAALYQHMQASVFRAVENRVYVIRAANTGVSCIISNNGYIEKIFKDKEHVFGEGYIVHKISPKDFRKTLYTRFGDVFVYLCFLLVAFAIFAQTKYFPRNIKPTIR